MENNSGDDNSSPKSRLLSLDALRGLDMFFLVGLAGIFQALPNFSDNAFNKWLANQCQHPEWQGFTAYDLIFPMFIFIVGVAMPFSFSKRIKEPRGKRKLFNHVLSRTIILTILGVILWGTPGGAHPHYGYYSVLFRIGFSYFFAAIIMMNSNIRGQIYWTFGLLIGYWLLMRFFPVPGYGIGDFTQDGNVATYFRGLVAENISFNFRFVFSITLITSISNALLGVLAGHWLLSESKPNKKAKWLLFAGIGLIIVSFISHLDFPINKRLASPSFTLLTSGISAVLLSLFYWIIDVKGYKKWAFFFVVVGVNPITIYVASSLLNFKKVAGVFVGAFDLEDIGTVALVLAITIAAIKWLFLYYLYRQRIFFKI
jgi:predicted acyltransferase